MTQISVTRALAEIKVLDARIETASQSGFLAVIINGRVQGSNETVEQVEKGLKANLQSVKALIERRAKLKALVVESNAKTQVQVGKETMSVAQAIERRGSIQYTQQLLANLRGQLARVTMSVDRVNQDVATRAEALVQTAIGRDRKADQAEIDAIVLPFKKSNEASVLDPNEASKEIERLQAEIDDFLLNVDFALSEVNAITKIDI